MVLAKLSDLSNTSRLDVNPAANFGIATGTRSGRKFAARCILCVIIRLRSRWTYYAVFLQSFANDVSAAKNTTDGGFDEAVASVTLVVGEWTHLAGVWASATSMKIYVDGVLKATVGAIGTVANIDELMIGVTADSTP